jgi:hypothetical protein
MVDLDPFALTIGWGLSRQPLVLFKWPIQDNIRSKRVQWFLQVEKKTNKNIGFFKL